MLDLGDITAARALEMYMPLWVRLFGAAQTPAFNIKVVAVDLTEPDGSYAVPVPRPAGTVCDNIRPEESA